MKKYTFNDGLFHFVLLLGALSAIGFLFFWEKSIYISHFNQFTPETNYVLSSATRHESRGKLGDFAHCLKTYKPIGWRASEEGKYGIAELKLDNHYVLVMRLSGNKTYSVRLSQFDHDGSKVFDNHSVALVCDLDLLDSNKPDEHLILLDEIDQDTAYQEIYVSDSDLALPKSKGKLGLFYQCLRANRPWAFGGQVETAVVKVKLRTTYYSGKILHLGVIGNKVINFSIEQYHKRILSKKTSKVYQVDCNVNLLDL